MNRIVLFLILLLLKSAGSSSALEHYPSGESSLTFGSQKILSSCWTEADLRGTAAEKKTSSKRLPPPPPLPPPSCQNALPPLPSMLPAHIRAVAPPPGEKPLALTFDLCEGQGEITGYDGDIVDFLRSRGLKATFFAGGKWLQSHSERGMQLMADPLFEIGNHSWDHPYFKSLSAPQIQEQVVRTMAQYELLWEKLRRKAQSQDIPASEMETIPRLPLTFRFPYGADSPEALQITGRLGLPAIFWSIVTADSWKPQTAEKIAHLILTEARPGSIIIMHANGKGYQTAQALAICLPKLLDKGFQFVTVSELLRTGSIIAR